MYALRRINVPDTLNAGYQRGHTIPDSVVTRWNLVLGEDYSADPPVDETAGQPEVARPLDDSDRGAWVAFAVAKGTDPEEAAQLQIDELAELHPDEDGAPADAGERPADSARKAEWVDYVVAAGADEAWARSGDTTKAELQEWAPPTAPAEPHTTDQAADQGNATVGQ